MKSTLKASELAQAHKDINRKMQNERIKRGNMDFASTVAHHNALVRILSAMRAFNKYEEAKNELERLGITY